MTHCHPHPKKGSCDLTSCASTDSDSDRDEELLCPKTNPLKHKTELCKNFSELGRCPYNKRCRFAHGVHELVQLPSAQSFRKRRCNGFWKNGYCSYGKRCQFGHECVEWDTQAVLEALQSVHVPAFRNGSKLLSLLAQ
jgi:hypothetical protein